MTMMIAKCFQFQLLVYRHELMSLCAEKRPALSIRSRIRRNVLGLIVGEELLPFFLTCEPTSAIVPVKPR